MAQRLAIALDFARLFVRWWLVELSFLVPPRLRKRLPGGDMLVLAFGADETTLSHEIGGKARHLGPVVTDPAAGGFRQIAGLLDLVPGLHQRAARGRVSVVVRLPAVQALRTRLTLPLAAEANLHQALVYQLDRRTPFPADTVYFAQRVVGRDDAAKQIEVELAVVPRSVVAAALAAGRTLGLHVDAVQIAGATPEEPPSENLIPEEDRQRRRPATRMMRAAMAGAAILAIAVLYRPVYAARQSVESLQHRVQAAKALAVRGGKLKDEVAKLTEAEQFLIGGKRGTLSATEILDAVTHVLPDDTWLEDLQLGGGEIRITGFSKSASALIKLIEQSGEFVNPQFRSAVTQDQATGKERFEITAKVAKKRSMS